MKYSLNFRVDFTNTNELEKCGLEDTMIVSNPI
jgi:hypothetical protein